MATQVGTEKVVASQSISATSDENTSERFAPKRGCRVVNESGTTLTFTVFQENAVTGNMVLCEDIAEMTLSAGASIDLSPLVFACERIALKLASGTANLHVATAE